MGCHLKFLSYRSSKGGHSELLVDFSKVFKFFAYAFACEPQWKLKVLIWAEIRTGWVRQRSPIQLVRRAQWQRLRVGAGQRRQVRETSLDTVQGSKHRALNFLLVSMCQSGRSTQVPPPLFFFWCRMCM